MSATNQPGPEREADAERPATDHPTVEHPTVEHPTVESPTPEHRRTHPVTPLITGWKIIAGIVAVLAVRNIPELIDDFTVDRALIALAGLVGVLVIAIGLSGLSWWRTTYSITPEGVVLHHGLLTRTRRTAPQEKIESVSVERPALARLLGLAKVRIESAGGSDSHLDIQYVTSAEAEQIRTRILRVAEQASGQDADAHPADASATDTSGTDASAADATTPDGAPHGRRLTPATARSFLHDGVTDGVLIAQIPTTRLLASMLRDISFMLVVGLGIAWAVVAIVLTLRSDGIGIGFLATAVPVILAVPRMILSRLEGGWGFVSRLTDRGLRMRRGLFSTRTDNIAPGRIQEFTLTQPLLWRRPGWIRARVHVAGIGGSEESSDDGAGTALPVGTRAELTRTLGHLMPSLGTEDDEAAIARLLGAPARSLDAIRPLSPVHWIARRTRAAVLLPGALVVRSGILTHRLVIIPRERIQDLAVQEGPVDRRLGCADLRIGVAGSATSVEAIPLADALALRDVLAVDAARGRRLSDRAHWPQPVLASRPATDPAR